MPSRKSRRLSKRSQAKPKATGRDQRRSTSSFSLWHWLPPERRLDLVGFLLILLGLLTLLGLASANQSALVSSWLHLLRLAFGWGIYILPVAMLGIGAWLVLRNVEQVTPLSVERFTGLLLLYLNLLTILHAFAGSPGSAVEIASAGAGGGYLGSLFVRLLWAALGEAGAIIALIAWLLIALSMSFDISIQELFLLFSPVATRLRQSLTQWRAKFQKPISQPEIRSNGFTPLQRPSTGAPSGDFVGQHPSAQLPNGPTSDLTPSESATLPTLSWVLPPVNNILDPGTGPNVNEEFIKQRARLIEDTLASFGAPAQVVEINRGPTITQFGVEPHFIETRSGRTRVRVSKIASLADDLALALAAPRVRIQAPVPGHSFVGIEVPNEEMTLVALRDIIESELFQRKRTPLRFALGRDVAGHPLLVDLASLPHLLIAGTTGSGKSVCVNAILTCFLLHNTPNDLRLILVDPKRVELTGYNGIPHLLAPVVVETERVIGALQWMAREMDKRYHTFAQVGARNIGDYNARMQLQGGKKLPYLVVVIDELADLMLIAPDQTERTITRLAQLARATGIHLILATQRPSTDVVTGLIKANFPARIAFAVASNVDSRVILDQPGAERLLGRGDMLYQAPDSPGPVRLQGVFVSDYEIQRLVEYWRLQLGGGSAYAVTATDSGTESGAAIDTPSPGVPLKQVPMWEEIQPVEAGDPLLDEAIDLVRRQGRASISMLQRRLRIGYTRAARLIDTLEEKGIVGPPEGATQVRSVLDYGPAAPPAED